MSTPSISPELDFLLTYLDLPAATDQPEAQWEQFQFEHLNNPSIFDIVNKSRRAGFSWLTAARGVARGKLKKRHTSTYVSISQEEATEKIRYAKQIIEALDREVRPRLIIDNALELEFDNGSRLISHPCRPIRGKGGDVYLDEFAHYAKDREIYTSAVPVVTKGGQLSIGSTPLGAGGVFWEIFEEKIKKYPGYRRSSVPWWSTAALCTDVAEAEKLAFYMLTEERVRLFGNQRLQEIFENVTLEDFQQEYECAWIDESVAWITWDEIKQNQVAAQAGQLWFRHATTVEAALQAIDDLAQAIREGKVESTLAGGMDVGRKHDLTELGFVGKSTTLQTPLRLMISLSRVPFEDQRAIAAKALTVLPVTGLLIDQNGLGMQLAEQLNLAFGTRAQGVDFTNATKELWSVELRVRMQKGHVPIPMDRDLSYQIHSIEKSVTASKNTVFDTAANEKHHADKYWMLALAVWATNLSGMTDRVVYDDDLRVNVGY